MDKEKEWQLLMNINNKAVEAIKKAKTENKDSIEVSFTLTELYEIAQLSGNEATIVKRSINNKEKEVY